MKLWRFTIKPLDGLESQEWDFRAPDEESAYQHGKSLAFDDGWTALDTMSRLKELNPDGTITQEA